MNPTLRALALLIGGSLVFLVSGNGFAQTSVEDRLKRLERVVNSDTLIDLLQQVQRLQAEVQELRGELEVQAHELTQMKRNQRDQYLDLDTRVGELEKAPRLPIASTETPIDAPLGDDSQTTPADPAKEQDTYQSAFDLLKAKKYDQAATAFSVFLTEYPAGRYAPNARYWLGEAHYVNQDFDAALTEFKTLIDTMPDSPKVSHAWLKIGFIQDDLGQYETAANTLNELIEKFPASSAAELAKERLEQMQSQ